MGQHYRLVGMLPVKNEVQNIERWLKRNGEFLDGIVALDDGSTDGTTELLRSHPKVISLIAKPPGTPWYLLKNRQEILARAKKTDAEWLFFLDADDIMEARFAGILDDLLKAEDVGRYKFREVTLWRSTRQYRTDKPGKYYRIDKYPTLVRNNPTLQWVPQDEGFMLNLRRRAARALKGGLTLHKPYRKRRYKGLRVTNDLVGFQGRSVDLGNTVALHYHYADWDLAWKKQIRYAINFSIAHDYKPQEIDSLFNYVTRRLDENGLQLAPVKPEWGVLH